MRWGAALRSVRKQPSVGIYCNQTSIAGQDVSIRMSQGQVVPCANMLEQLFQWVSNGIDRASEGVPRYG